MKKIGIIGSGQVAKTLGNGFLSHNYEVMLGSRDTEKLAAWKKDGGDNAQVGSVEDAAKFGDLIVLAVKGLHAAEVLEAAGPQNMQKKTVIDTTNPIANEAPEDGVLKYFTTLDESLMERLQTQFPEIHFVKAFNTVGNGSMVNPKFTEKPTMFICGNNMAAKKETTDVLEQFGWEVADMGKDTAARAIEPICMLMCIQGFNENTWNNGIRLMKC